MPLLAPITPQLPPNHRVRQDATRIKTAPRRITDQLVRQWEADFDLLWSNDGGVTPAQRLAEIGTAAAELFTRNTALVGFLASQLTGEDDVLVARLLAKIEAMPATTVHEDGTVTID